MKITLNKEVEKNLAMDAYYSQENFIKDVKRYIKACKSGRLLYQVTHVSNSGMSRNINIMSFEGSMTSGSYCTYYSMLKALGYKFADKYSSEIKVSGCGMNMLFATNYNLIHSFYNMGFINKKECDILAQKIN